eukprot:EG_transcript_30468
MGASTMAGLVPRFLFYPLDTCKARLQASSEAADTVQYAGLWPCAQAIWAEEGLAGFYRGLAMSLLGSAPGTCLYLTSYEASRQWLADVLPGDRFVTPFLAGIFAEAFSCIVWVPVDVVKERLQIQRDYDAAAGYRGSWHALVTILRLEGVTGLYKGYLSTLLAFGPNSALFFLFYELLRPAAGRLPPGPAFAATLAA